MATTLYLSPIALILQQVFTNTGIMAQGGQATIFEAGTTTLAETFTDSTGIVANPNPITLNSAGRIASNSGAPVAVWAPSGTVLTVAVVDNQGNQLIYLPFIPGINDPSSGAALQTLLASPASSNPSGVGPVAGADLVANAVKSYDIFADVRAANQPALASGQTLIIVVEGAITVGDQLGGLFYWSSSSTASDDGSLVLKPTSVTGPGRYLRLVLPETNVANGEETFEASLTDGVNNSGLFVVNYNVVNGIVTLRATGTTFASGADVMTMLGLPPALAPASILQIPTIVTDSGTAGLLGAVQFAPDGSITFLIGNPSTSSTRVTFSSSGFAGSSTKGIANWTVSYPQN